MFVSQQPAELIVTDGQAQHRTVGAAGLEYVDDTESDVFRYKFQYYYLVSGRWFTAGILRGPWEAVTELPEVFSSIPEDHEKSHVLAAVPHTDEARMAVMEATIPRKATIDRDAGENVSVFYEGEAIFEDVPGTDVKRAVNSPNDILLIGSTYYLCDSAVWYVSTTEDGPWVVADEIPAVIYSIPPSSPSYHVTHVEIEESDSETVSTSYDSGYFGSNVSFGVVVYGSGWYYPPYYGYYPGYPYYYPHPYSYGARRVLQPGDRRLRTGPRDVGQRRNRRVGDRLQPEDRYRRRDESLSQRARRLRRVADYAERQVAGEPKPVGRRFQHHPVPNFRRHDRRNRTSATG